MIEDVLWPFKSNTPNLVMFCSAPTPSIWQQSRKEWLVVKAHFLSFGNGSTDPAQGDHPAVVPIDCDLEAAARQTSFAIARNSVAKLIIAWPPPKVWAAIGT
jgi:hypothetical protein